MKNVTRGLAVAGLIVCWAQAAAAQTVDEIVEKHLAAIGGRAVLAKVTSRSMTGTITVATPVGEVSGPIEIVNQSPNKTRMLVTLDLSSLGAGKMVLEERFDGTSGYVMDTMQGNREMAGAQLENSRNETFPTPLLDYKDRGHALELVGKEKVGDREAYLLVLKPKSGPPIRRFIDAESFLETRLVSTASAPEVGDFEQTVDLLDYRQVDGVRVPFMIKGTSTAQNFTVTFATVVHNQTIEQALFSRPAN